MTDDKDAGLLTEVDRAVLLAVLASKTSSPRLLEGYLRAHLDFHGGSVRVLDDSGKPRYDASAFPLAVNDLVAELRSDPSDSRILWPTSPNPGMTPWQR